MVKPVMTVSVSITDPLLLRRYAIYIKAGTEGRRQNKKVATRLQDKLEEQLATISDSVNSGSGKTEIRLADFKVNAGLFQEGIEKVLAGTVNRIEAKLKTTDITERLELTPNQITEGRKLGSFRRGTEISGSAQGKSSRRFTRSILEQSKIAQRLGQVIRNERNKGKDLSKLTAKELQLENNLDLKELKKINLFEHEAIKLELNANGGTKLLEVIKSNRALTKRFRAKASVLQLVTKVNNKLILTTMRFSRNHFRVPPFKFRISKKGVIIFSLNDIFERQLQSKIRKSHENIVPLEAKDYQKGVLEIAAGKNSKILTMFNGVPVKLVTSHRSGGSIPMGIARVIGGKQQSNLRRRGAQRGRRRREGVAVKQITAAQFSALLRARIAKIGPFGPIGGSPPAASTRLTHRTGTYLNSIHMTSLNLKSRIFTYWYNPKYFIHENEVKGGQRDPKKLIEPTIRSLAREVLGIDVFAGKRGN